jgi:hypothetical protein
MAADRFRTVEACSSASASSPVPAKDAGVPPEGSGSHRLVIGGDVGSFTDQDGFEWEAVAA